MFWCFSFQQDIVLSPWKFKSPFEKHPIFLPPKKQLKVYKACKLDRERPWRLQATGWKKKLGWKFSYI